MAESTDREGKISMIMSQSINKLLKDLSPLQPSGTPVSVVGSLTILVNSTNEVKLTFNKTFAFEKITGTTNTTIGPRQLPPTKKRPTSKKKPKPKKKIGGSKGNTLRGKNNNAVRPTKRPTPVLPDVKQPDEPGLPDIKQGNSDPIVIDDSDIEAPSTDLEAERGPSISGTTKRKADVLFGDIELVTKHPNKAGEMNQRQCYFCSEGFATKEALAIHMRKSHTSD